MALDDQWCRGFAVQAHADLRTRERLGPAAVPECHRLQFLQMACEKLVKAYLFGLGAVPAGTLTSHAVIAKHLPNLINEHYRVQTGRSLPRFRFNRIRHLARQIEMLAPSVDNAGQQPANCEYPWLSATGDRVLVPAEQDFRHLELSREAAGRLILKVLPIAIEKLLASSASSPTRDPN